LYRKKGERVYEKSITLSKKGKTVLISTKQKEGVYFLKIINPKVKI
jgi:hypothetical protein